jgi:hypothetical protein
MCQDTPSFNCGSTINTHTGKRKRSLSLTVVRPSKRHPKLSIASKTKDLVQSPLVKILREYDMLETIVSNICADDLLALALTSKALHEIIMSRKVSLENLLGRLICSGKGIEIRNRCHKKSTFFYSYNCSEYVTCGSKSITPDIETKPCSTCMVATCNECRVHCVYQSIYEASSDPNEDGAELPNFSGFVLLQPSEQPILSPHHLILGEVEVSSHWQDPSTGLGGPYHDQGYLDAPLQMDATGPPECIQEVLDIDLGKQGLMSISEDSRYGHPSPVLSSLCSVVDARKVFLCDICFMRDVPKGPQAMKYSQALIARLPWLARRTATTSLRPCHCTLRSRFLDRWLCLRCYQKEDSAISRCTGTMPPKCTSLCGCGMIARHTLCLWCWGEVAEEEMHIELADVDTNDATSSSDSDHASGMS